MRGFQRLTWASFSCVLPAGLALADFLFLHRGIDLVTKGAGEFLPLENLLGFDVCFVEFGYLHLPVELLLIKEAEDRRDSPSVVERAMMIFSWSEIHEKRKSPRASMEVTCSRRGP